jgi:predicted GTPase
MALIAEDIKNVTKLFGTDLIIAYGLSQIHQYVTDNSDGFRVMGPTGTGKSNVRDILYIFFSISPGLKIIDTFTNQPGRRASSRLVSCTTEVRAVRLFNHPVHGDRLVFVDTPGFDNTNKSDLEILQMVSNWLQKV